MSALLPEAKAYEWQPRLQPQKLELRRKTTPSAHLPRFYRQPEPLKTPLRVAAASQANSESLRPSLGISCVITCREALLLRRANLRPSTRRKRTIVKARAGKSLCSNPETCP